MVLSPRTREPRPRRKRCFTTCCWALRLATAWSTGARSAVSDGCNVMHDCMTYVAVVVLVEWRWSCYFYVNLRQEIIPIQSYNNSGVRVRVRNTCVVRGAHSQQPVEPSLAAPAAAAAAAAAQHDELWTELEVDMRAYKIRRIPVHWQLSRVLCTNFKKARISSKFWLPKSFCFVFLS